MHKDHIERDQGKQGRGELSQIQDRLEADTTFTITAADAVLRGQVLGVCRLGSMNTLQIHTHRLNTDQSSTRRGSHSGPHSQIGEVNSSHRSRCRHTTNRLHCRFGMSIIYTNTHSTCMPARSEVLHFVVVQYKDRGRAIAEHSIEHSGPAFKPGFAGRSSGFTRWPEHMACPVQAPQRRTVRT